MYAKLRTWWHTVSRPEARAVVLMYHRVADLIYDPWQLAVGPDRFEQQLQQLRRRWNPISLAELVHDIAAGTVRDRSVVLTFDDGYIDNFTTARPLLEKYQIPATFFITTANCSQQTPYWWDELQTLILETHTLPDLLTLFISGECFTYRLGAEAVLSPALADAHTSWLATGEPPTARSRLYYELWRRLKPLPADAQRSLLTRLNQWAGSPVAPTDLPACMNTQQLQVLSAHPLFTIGSHTTTHLAMADHTPVVCTDEVASSKRFLETVLNQPIQTLAYPYGSCSPAATAAVSDAAIRAAVTTQEGVITNDSALLALGRFQVNDWPADTFTARLDAWYKRA